MDLGGKEGLQSVEPHTEMGTLGRWQWEDPPWHWQRQGGGSAAGVGRHGGEQADGELEGVLEIELVPPYF